ncbi:hypothetical protein C7S14_7860 [Burkholderia cepacia]|nr:hypothetical protein C7S14_7860 [Burkholderia cepacia]
MTTHLGCEVVARNQRSNVEITSPEIVTAIWSKILRFGVHRKAPNL